MHIISTDEKQVFAAVQEWNQNNTYSLYISDSPGVYFTLSLENLRTSRGPAGNLLVDFYKVRSEFLFSTPDFIFFSYSGLITPKTPENHCVAPPIA